MKNGRNPRPEWARSGASTVQFTSVRPAVVDPEPVVGPFADPAFEGLVDDNQDGARVGLPYHRSWPSVDLSPKYPVVFSGWIRPNCETTGIFVALATASRY